MKNRRRKRRTGYQELISKRALAKLLISEKMEALLFPRDSKSPCKLLISLMQKAIVNIMKIH